MRTVFQRDVYIRLSEDGTHLISTTRYGRFFKRRAEFDMTCEPDRPDGADRNDARKTVDARETVRETVEEKPLALLRKRLSYWASDEQGS